MSRFSDTDTDLILCTSKLDSSWSCLNDIQERTLITLNLIVFCPIYQLLFVVLLISEYHYCNQVV